MLLSGPSLKDWREGSESWMKLISRTTGPLAELNKTIKSVSMALG